MDVSSQNMEFQMVEDEKASPVSRLRIQLTHDAMKTQTWNGHGDARCGFSLALVNVLDCTICCKVLAGVGLNAGWGTCVQPHQYHTERVSTGRPDTNSSAQQKLFLTLAAFSCSR